MGDVCRQVDPGALAAVLRQAYTDSPGRRSRGEAAARRAKELVVKQGGDALADAAWGRVLAHLKERAAGLEQQQQQHRKIIA